MHFFHVSVTQGRRLNANKIYTRQSLLNFYPRRDASKQSRRLQ